MTVWDVVDKIMSSSPPIVLTLMLIAVLVAVIIFIRGFSKHGVNFLKYGFEQKEMGDLMAKLATKEDINKLETDISDLRADLKLIKVNHFGHLKNFLTELTSILLDKGIINNENKARLDNQLHGM